MNDLKLLYFGGKLGKNNERCAEMKKTISLFLSFLLLCHLLSGCASEQNSLYMDYARLADNVTPDMLSVAAWVKPSQKTWLSPEKIEEINTLNRNVISLGDKDVSLENLAEEITSGDVRAILEELNASVKDLPGYLERIPVDNDYWQKHIDNTNADGIPETLNVRYGFSVCRASLRLLPCADFIGESETDLFYDKMLMSEFLPFMPLVIVHESTDQEWYFVFMYGFGGWIQKENVAICPSKEDWIARQNPEDFLVVTGREIRLNIDRGSEQLSGLLLPMGTVLPLVKTGEAPERIHGRYNYSNYIVRLPVRGFGGRIMDNYAFVPVTEDVSHGYLPYNGSTVVELAMKRLGDRYGWGGLDYSQDCSGMLREIFSCFNIFLPRTAGQQAAIKGVERYDLSGMDNDAKLSLLKKLPAGTLLSFPGHIMLYLGMKDKLPFVISAVGSFMPLENKEDAKVESINTVVINDLCNIYRRSGTSWLENLTDAVVIR